MYCDDCGCEHTCSVEDHLIFCEARTCESCFHTFTLPLSVNVGGKRLCYDCQRADDAELLYSGMEEMELEIEEIIDHGTA